MSSYSMQLRTIIEQATQYEDDLTTREKIEKGRKKLFDFHYPIFDEDYRGIFETNFIRHFYTREIGFEVEELFKFKLETWLLINMPYYNKLFESELIKFDPLSNSKMEKLHQKSNEKDQKDNRKINQSSTSQGTSDTTSNQTATSTGEATEDQFNRDLKSDNPDSRLAITTQQGKGVIEYASNIDESKTDNKTNTKNDSSSDVKANEHSSASSNADQTNELDSSINEEEFFLEKRIGKIGVQSYSKMVQEFRQSFIRVEKQMFQEMQELFMMVY